MNYLSLFLGAAIVALAAGIIYWIFSKITDEVHDETEVFVLSFGQVKRRLNRPGLHFIPEKVLPWTQLVSISKQIDFRTFKNVQVNDHYGTTVILDLWIEFKITDPYKALFSVESWEEVLESLVIHTMASILSSQTVPQILKNRNELAVSLQTAIARETERWGISITGAMIQNVGLLPEISKQFFNTVAARIERTKALVEEEGRLSVAKLEAETFHKVAELNALAKAQLPLAIGNAYHKLSSDPKSLQAFKQYWELQHLDPRKTVSFNGFSGSSLSAVEASMALESLVNH